MEYREVSGTGGEGELNEGVRLLQATERGRLTVCMNGCETFPGI